MQARSGRIRSPKRGVFVSPVQWRGMFRNHATGWALVLIATGVTGFSESPQPISASVRFTDIAQKAGIAIRMTNGGTETKKYIFESTGSGVALIDYDRDGYPDIFLVNGSRLDGFGSTAPPTNHLFHNNRDGTFTDVSATSGVASSGWGHGVCV